MANKNSTYVNALVAFILDTKPYHSKLSEIVEEYRFTDTMSVNFGERMFSSVLAKGAWPTSYFSGGPTGFAPTVPLHRLVSPSFSTFTKNSTPAENRGSFRAFRDENTDLPLVPFAFDPRSSQGRGISDAFVQRAGQAARSEPLLEGHDFFESRGAFVFQIKQTISSQPLITGRFAETYEVTDTFPISVQLSFQADSLLLLGPVTQVSLSEVQITGPGAVKVMGLSDKPNYLPVFVERANENLPASRESGALAYPDVLRSGVSIFDISANFARALYEEWSVEATSATTFIVRGKVTGIIGAGTIAQVTPTDGAPYYAGEFDSFQLSFSLRADQQLNTTDVLALSPSSKIAVHPTAPLEAWSLIKVNPIAYSRPLFTSTRYGYLTDTSGTKNKITVLDTGFKTGSVVLTAISSTQFIISATSDLEYAGVATVNTLFNDGVLAFTIRAGTDYQFTAGDRFDIEIQNNEPVADDLDLFYGYDFDSYDASELVYNATNSAGEDYFKTLDFKFDTRFASYDLKSFNLVLAGNVVSGRQWRLRALPDFDRPLPLQSTSPENRVNLAGTDSTAVPVYDSENTTTAEGVHSGNDPDTTADLLLWYSSSFALEYFDTETLLWVLIDNIQVGNAYSNTGIGLSFKLVEASKPFIAARLNSSRYQDTSAAFIEESVFGGDVISWTVRNSPPEQIGAAALGSARIPRLVMHGAAYHNSTPAKWVLTWVSNTAYELQGFYTAGALNGSPVFSTPRLVQLEAGFSYRDREHGLHFTIRPGRTGLKQSDSIAFETLNSRPSYLVHGSVSGWQPAATVGEWYWNGKIGFKITAPTAELFISNQKVPGDGEWQLPAGLVSLKRLRQDAPDLTYVIKSLADGAWNMYRNGALVARGTNSLSDDYVLLEVPTAVAGSSFILQITGDEHRLALGHDLAIIKTTAGRSPTAADFVLLERTTTDAISISIKAKDAAHAEVLAPLAPQTIDVRFVDHTARSGVPLFNTSPETAVLQGWIPASTEFRDSALSIAEFSDPATHAVIRAAVTGELIGTVRTIGSLVTDPVIFDWDLDFHTKYLPLNAESTLVTFGSGMNEHVIVNMQEGIAFLLKGDGGESDALFSEVTGVQIAELNELLIKSSYDMPLDVTVSDGPFIGFLPGYDNTPYDAEVADGAYDTGLPLTDYFLEAKALSARTELDPVESSRLNDLIALISGYLINNALDDTTFGDFIAAFNAAVASGDITPNFGVPAIGAGFEVQENSGVTASTAITEALSVFALDTAYGLDQYGLDAGPMDGQAESTAIIYSAEMPPLPAAGLPPAGTLYSEFETPFVIPAPGARVIELSFSMEPSTTPVFYVWRPEDPAPELATVVERGSSRLFRLSLIAQTELKLIVL